MHPESSNFEIIMTGLLFGSFNPIHKGHTSLAEWLLEHTSLEEIWFVLSPLNPMKESHQLYADELRLQMLEAAIAYNHAFRACEIEFSMPKPNYTVDTLRCLRNSYPSREFALIIGADNLAIFDQWKNYEEILTKHPLLVYPREGTELAVLSEKYPNAELMEEAPLFPLSSTDIRKMLLQKEDASAYLHPDVLRIMRDCVV